MEDALTRSGYHPSGGGVTCAPSPYSFLLFLLPPYILFLSSKEIKEHVNQIDQKATKARENLPQHEDKKSSRCNCFCLLDSCELLILERSTIHISKVSMKSDDTTL